MFEFTPKIYHNGFAFAELDCEAEIERDGTATFYMRDLEGDWQRVDEQIAGGAYLASELRLYISKNVWADWIEYTTDEQRGFAAYDLEIARGG